MERIFAAQYCKLKAIIDYVKEELIRLGFTGETVNAAHIICDEIITNIIKYAYEDDAEYVPFSDGAAGVRPLHIACLKTPERLFIEFIDWGRPFNPQEYRDDLRAEENPGGLGIHIAKGLADDFHYCRETGKNILTISLSY